MRRRFFGSGFTLIELIIVMAILTIMTAIAVPYLAPLIVSLSLEGGKRRRRWYEYQIS